MKKYFVETIGTFFLSLALLLLSQKPESAVWGSITGGLILAALIYNAQHLSGGHFNPAITVAMLMRGAITRIQLPWYILTQLIGGLLAALAAYFLMACQGVLDFRMMNGLDPLCALPAEFFGAFGLSFMYMRAYNSGEDVTGSAMLTGAMLAGLMLMFAPISGALFNPALALSYCIAGAAPWGHLWLYILGPLIGAAAAASVWVWMTAATNES